MIRVIAAAAACVLALHAGCGFSVPAGGDAGLDPDGTPPVVVTVGFAGESSLVDESSGAVRIPVQLSEPANDTVTVEFDVTDGTATPPEDYEISAAARTLTFPPGEVTQHIELLIKEDLEEEPDETIVLELASPTGAVLGTSAHTLTISANTLPRVTVRMSKASDTENKSHKVVFELDTESSADVSVEFMVAGTAGPADHALVPGTITFPAGSKKEERELGVVNDALDEDDETVIVSLQNPVGALLGDPTVATYTILDDDAEPTVTFTTDHQTVAESATTVTFDVSLSAISGRTVSVPYTVAGTATAGADYTISPASTLTFPAGTQVQQIAITILQDTMPEPDETVVLTLGTPMHATLGNPTSRTRTLTISNDDPWCGGTGSFEVCYPHMPSSAQTLPGSIDTDSSTLCQAAQPTNWIQRGQPEACVVLATDINITNTTVVTGSRPLVLFASSDLTITANGVLDASSTRGGRIGPAAPFASCGAPSRAPGAGGGGAGGSFLTRGGNGGPGNGGSFGGLPGDEVQPPPTLRAGCDGQAGGENTDAVGRGGGAVYLLARNALVLQGTINASGSAGRGGQGRTGGNGGGSGGMIVLHAATIDANGGKVLANGGGGAGGGSPGAGGQHGEDPSASAPLVPAEGGMGPGGVGGRGDANSTPAGNGGGNSDPTSGGGGGGGGGGYIDANHALTGAQVSAGRIDAP